MQHRARLSRFSSLAVGMAVAAVGTLVTIAPVVGSAQAAPSPAITPAPPPVDTPSCGGERPRRPTGGFYYCQFDDEFNGLRLDPDKWMRGDTSISGFTTGINDCYTGEQQNAWVFLGTLRLTAQRKRTPFLCLSPYGAFRSTSTAGSITTRGRFSQAYGRFEFRARLPDTRASGVHSALWLYPNGHAYGRWPLSGEIDVAEWFSAVQDRVYPSLHYKGRNKALASGYNCVVTDTENYHRYAVEWTPDMMRFLYDGRVCFRHSWTPTAPMRRPKPFDRPFNVVLTQGFGTSWNPITSDTPRSATMQVDWVRVWK